MADVVGAAAGCGMLCLILMLIGGFLTEIHLIRRETLKGCGRVFLCCGLFAGAHYGIVALARAVLYGMQDMNGFMALVQHEAFARFYDLPENAAMYAITVSVMITAVSGCLLFFGIKGMAGSNRAMKALILFYLLPGMGSAFLPLGGCVWALVAAVILFVVCKCCRLPKGKMPVWLYGSVFVLLAICRCFMLFRWTMGV